MINFSQLGYIVERHSPSGALAPGFESIAGALYQKRRHRPQEVVAPSYARRARRPRGAALIGSFSTARTRPSGRVVVRVQSALLFLGAGLVRRGLGGVHVNDLERSSAIHLEDVLAFRPTEVMHFLRHQRIRADG